MKNTAPPAGSFTLLAQNGPFRLFQHADPSNQPPNSMGLKLECDSSGRGVIARDLEGSWTVGNLSIREKNVFRVPSHSGKTDCSGFVSHSYNGTGSLNLLIKQPHILLLDTADWGNAIELDARRFLACSGNLSAYTGVLPDSGSPNAVILTLTGRGVVCILSDWPMGALSYEQFQGTALTVYDSSPVAWNRELAVSAGATQGRSFRTYRAKRSAVRTVLLHPSTLQ